MATRAQREKRKARRTAGKRNRLSNVQVDEVSLVDNPAVPEAEFVIAKRLTEEELMALEKDLKADDIAKLVGELGSEGSGAESSDQDGQPIAKDGDGSATDTAPDEPVEKTEPTEPEPETEPVEKAANATVGRAWAVAIQGLRKVASAMTGSDLHQLAAVMEYVSWAYAEVPAVANELGKCEVTAEADVVAAYRERPAYKAMEELISKTLKADVAAAEVTPEPVEKTEPVSEPVEPVEPEPVEKNEQKEPTQPSLMAEASELLAKRRAEVAQGEANRAEAEAMRRLVSLGKQLEETLTRAGTLGSQIDKALGKVE